MLVESLGDRGQIRAIDCACLIRKSRKRLVNSPIKSNGCRVDAVQGCGVISQPIWQRAGKPRESNDHPNVGEVCE